MTVEVSLEVSEGYLITGLVLAVFLALLLDCVVGEVNHLVGEVLEVELLAGSANIALLEPIALGDAVR